MTDQHRNRTEDRTLAALTRDLVRDVTHLFRQEWLLVQVEAREKLSQAQAGVISLAAGLLVALAALIILLEAVAVALANFVEPWLASLIVGVVTAIVAFVLIAAGRRALSTTNLAPERSMRSARETGDAVKEKLT